MNELTYIIFIVILTVFILLYGGHNNQDLIEYDAKFFKNFNKLIIFEKKLQIYNSQVNFGNLDYINLQNYIKTSMILIPNLVSLYFINIKPSSFFKISKIFDEKLNKKEHLMIIFNHDKINNLELLVGLDGNSIGYFYDLKQNISIVGIYDLFNSSANLINLTIFFIRKPFWYN